MTALLILHLISMQCTVDTIDVSTQCVMIDPNAIDDQNFIVLPETDKAETI